MTRFQGCLRAFFLKIARLEFSRPGAPGLHLKTLDRWISFTQTNDNSCINVTIVLSKRIVRPGSSIDRRLADAATILCDPFAESRMFDIFLRFPLTYKWNSFADAATILYDPFAESRMFDIFLRFPLNYKSNSFVTP